MTHVDLRLPTFGRVLSQLDGRLKGGTTLFDLVTSAEWKQQWASSSGTSTQTAMEFCGEHRKAGYSLVYRYVWRHDDKCNIYENQLPVYHMLRLRVRHDPLFPFKEVEHRFIINDGTDGVVLMEGGVHSPPYFVPFYGHPFSFKFPDAEERSYTWLADMVLDRGKVELDDTGMLAEGSHQIFCALWLLAVSVDTHHGTLRLPFMSREEAGKALARKFRNTRSGD